MRATWYEIRVQGILSPEWAEWFEGLEIRQVVEKETILAGWIADQAALYGCLSKLRNLNLVLLSVNPAAPSEPPAAQHESQGE